MTIKFSKIINIMETYFPPYLAQKWDNVGLQIGSYDQPVEKIMLSLDLNEAIVEQAISAGVDAIITHHPLFFKEIKNINLNNSQGKIIKALIKADISVYTAHTNLDAAEQGLNQFLAEKIGLCKIKRLNNSYQEEVYKLVVFVPVGYAEQVRAAINNAGAGFMGNYSDCSFRAMGKGTFRPRTGSDPFIGNIDELEEVEEVRLETIVPEQLLNKVITAMLKAHPYEEVAYDVITLHKQGKTYSLGRIGYLPEAMTLDALVKHIKNCLDLKCIRVCTTNEKKAVKKIGLVSGAGASFIAQAHQQGCDAFLTGDLKYHEAQEAINLGIAVIDAGHQGTEQIVKELLLNTLKKECAEKNYPIKFLLAQEEEVIKNF